MLGDSITEYTFSEECPLGYRYELWKELVRSGIDFQLVGTRHFDHPLPDFMGKHFADIHQAQAGWTTYDFVHGRPVDPRGSYEGTIDTMVSKSFADIVLLHLGTNDSLNRRPLKDYIADMQSIIKTLQKRNLKVKIFVAQIIPAPKAEAKTGGVMIPVYNAALPALAEELTTASSPVVVVDQFSGYDADIDNACSDSKIHPGKSGAKKMAARWMQVLKH